MADLVALYLDVDFVVFEREDLEETVAEGSDTEAQDVQHCYPALLSTSSDTYSTSVPLP